MLTVRRYPDPVLMKKSTPVTDFGPELKDFVEQMFETMYMSKGVGLAAPQVGVNKRIFVVNCNYDEMGADAEIALINPEIVEMKETYTSGEGCLSFPGVYAEVERARIVKIRYQDVDGKWQEHIGEDLLARAFQHELDHLEGKVFIDYLTPAQRIEISKEIEELKREFKRNQR